MSYLWSVGAIEARPFEEQAVQCTYTCKQARLACRPAFVFSISGQVGFRNALDHLQHCASSDCQKLRRSVIRGFKEKIHWLGEEDALLGCEVAQELLYYFAELATHLSRCPKENCAQLRRAVLLNVRSAVGDEVPSP